MTCESSRLLTRVQCATCHAHRMVGPSRYARHSSRCGNCHSYAYDPVPPSPGDVPGLLSDVVQLVADLLTVDPSPEHAALAAAVTAASREVPLV